MLLAGVMLGGCSKNARETALTVLTLQDGSASALRDARGSGPFRTYPVPPDEMLRIVESVLRTKAIAVFPEPRRGLVCAKERSGRVAADDTYGETWDSAVVVYVHPVTGDPSSSKVEVHAMQRGPLHKGRMQWELELPPAFDDAVTHRDSTPIRPLR